MKTNKKVQKNSVQKSEKEIAVKVTALAIIPKPMMLFAPQDVFTAIEVPETPEAATAFKRLLEKGRYDIYSLAERFGRSERYIYTRLKLNELYAPIGELLDNDTITISVAEEISTYEPISKRTFTRSTSKKATVIIGRTIH